MSALSVVSSAEIDRLFAVLPGDEATKILSFVDALKVFARAANKPAAARAMALRLQPLGFKGLSYKSLMRKLDDYARGGVWSLVPAKYRKEEVRGLMTNAAFIEHWQTLCLENRRKVHAAWSRLIAELSGGLEIPGIGTWHELYLKMRGFLPSAGEPCPWDERNPPPGWSYRNLLNFVPDEFAMVAAHRGMAEAKTRFGLKVVKTRVGLTCCQLVEVDDMWYEHPVMMPGNREPQRVVEFAAFDVLTGHVLCHLTKPIREKDDGTRETLKSAWVKYVYHYLLCVSGIPREGCCIKGEKGTAKGDAEFKEALEVVNGWLTGAKRGGVAFDSGSLMNAPIAKGLHNGAAKGNPRNKPHIEQMHATLKNRIGHILGEIGGGRGIQPEETGAMVAEAKKLTALAYACNIPLDKMQTPFLSFAAYAEIIEKAHDEIDRRTVHSLEGWEECGFVKGEFRLKSEASWRAVKPLSDMSPEEAGAISALVKAGMAEFREVRLSPREAWEKSKGVLETVPPYLAPKILGSELAVTAKVNSNMQFVYKDENIGSKLTVAAIADGKLLKRGVEYRLWVNPLDGDKAYVCDLQGVYLGIAKVMQAVSAAASPQELAAQLGLRQKVLSEESKRLVPLAKKRLKAAIDRATANLAALGLEDPVERTQIEDARQAALEGAETVDAAALIAPEADGETDGIDVSSLI